METGVQRRGTTSLVRGVGQVWEGPRNNVVSFCVCGKGRVFCVLRTGVSGQGGDEWTGRGWTGRGRGTGGGVGRGPTRDL